MHKQGTAVVYKELTGLYLITDFTEEMKKMRSNTVILALLISAATISSSYSMPISFSTYIKNGECHVRLKTQ